MAQPRFQGFSLEENGGYFSLGKSPGNEVVVDPNGSRHEFYDTVNYSSIIVCKSGKVALFFFFFQAFQCLIADRLARLRIGLPCGRLRVRAPTGSTIRVFK